MATWYRAWSCIDQMQAGELRANDVKLRFLNGEEMPLSLIRDPNDNKIVLVPTKDLPYFVTRRKGRIVQKLF